MSAPTSGLFSARTLLLIACCCGYNWRGWTRPFMVHAFVARSTIHLPHATLDDRCRSSRLDEHGGGISDWLIENLEQSNSGSSSSASGIDETTIKNSITSRSAVRAGENDTLPLDGLLIGKMRILAADAGLLDGDGNDGIGLESALADQNAAASDTHQTIRLLVGRNGWGTGVHPTTRLCLEWICDNIYGGETVLDYGCGSGVLSIAALRMGAAQCIGVDVEAEALVTATRNVALNGYSENEERQQQQQGVVVWKAYHTREILPYGILPANGGVDVCVANILVGQLVRPSMVAALVTNIAPSGLLCLSGIRPGEQVEALKEAYDAYMDWIDYAELAASDTAQSIASYGFDCGVWCRLVGRKRPSARSDDVLAMSELAIS